MGTVASTARIKLTGFNTEGVDAYSPLEDQVALTYRAAYHFASANGFKPHTHRGVAGRAGPMVMKRITDSLFDHADKDVRDKLNGLISQVLRKCDAAVCIVHPADRETMPTWFVANKMPPNLTIVALSHAHNDRKPPREPNRLIPTHTEQRLTAQEAGENMPPGEVTVKQTEPKRQLTPEERVAPIRDRIDAVVEEHKRFLEELFRLIAAHTPVSAPDLKHLMGRADSDSSAITGSVKELADAGRIVGRLEEDDERRIRGGGELPKGKRVMLWAPAPGPVPKRTKLPEGVPPMRGAKTWAEDYKKELDSWCDKVLEELAKSYPKHENRPRSAGRLSEVTGLTLEQTKSAIERLAKLELIYDNGHYTYYLAERRRGPKAATTAEPIPPYANGSADQEAARQAVAPPVQAPVLPTEVPPEDLVAAVAELIQRYGKSGDEEQLREQLRVAEETIAKQARIITSLRGAIAAMEE